MSPSDRKARTEEILIEKGIPVLPSLPCIESEDVTHLRTPEEVGIRMFCLFCTVGVAYQRSDESYVRFLNEHRLWDHLSPKEVRFISDPAPDRLSVNAFTWRCEALFLLMWAVWLFRSLPIPTSQTENERMIDIFPSFSESPWPFIRSLRLRPKSEILDKSDLLYRLNWAARSAESKEQKPPAGLEPGVVEEWHYAINWITKYEGLDWDEVATDT
jgi:hypothetical protein